LECHFTGNPGYQKHILLAGHGTFRAEQDPFWQFQFWQKAQAAIFYQGAPGKIHAYVNGRKGKIQGRMAAADKVKTWYDRLPYKETNK
jgi:hypothetical protein